VLSVEGIFSGTLAYLFNVYDGTKPFSAIVADARQRGYTEPDPRDDLRQRLDDAKARGKVLRYVARVTADGHATVGLAELDTKHAFANIALTDNVVRYATQRYCDNPLIVQGPGAGPEVTAGGVFADLLRVAAYLGARL